MHDGDTMFALSTGKKNANVNIVGAYAAQAVQQAILNAYLRPPLLEEFLRINDLTD